MKKSMLLKRLILVSATCTAALFFSSANAATIQWSLSGVTFDDGGTASGTFSTDSVSGNLLSYNLTTSAGSTLPGFNYNASNSSIYGNNVFSVNSFLLTNNSPFAIPYLNLSFQNSLTTAAGATDALINNNSWECNNCSSVRYITGGEAVSSAVPEPETYAMLLVGLGLMGFLRRRRKTS